MSLKPWLWAGAAVALPAAAMAATGQKDAPSEVLFLGQVVVLLVAGRLMGEALARLGQPSIMGQLLAGILLGKSALGAAFPEIHHALFPDLPQQKAMLDGIAQVGILLLLLLTGMETDVPLVRRAGRAAFTVSLAGIAIPFACGFALGEFLPDSILPNPQQRLVTSLFLGTALSISSVKIVAAVVREMNFMRRSVGQVIVGAAIVDDSIGWIIIAMTFSIALNGAVEPVALAQTVLGTLFFLAASITVGRRVVFLLIRWVNDNFVSEAAVITMILAIAGGMALTTHLIGVHSVLGAFVAGVLVGQSPILTRQIDEQLRGLITALFMPVFFGLSGLHADLTILGDGRLLLLSIGLILIASIGKFGGAFIGAELGGMSRREAIALGCGMNARGSTEVIVATIGLSIGALTEDLFTMIVAMAIVTTLAMPPMLRWSLARLPLSDAEKARLEREEFEQRGFIPGLERLLVAADDSSTGMFASRLTGFLAGLRGTPVTMLRLVAESASPADAKTAASALEQAAARAKAHDADSERPPDKVDVTTKAKAEPGIDAVEKEARKGYDLLVIGMEEAPGAEDRFHPRVDETAAKFEGPIAVVLARGSHAERPRTARLDILVPVTGTEASRRATELAVALSRASGAPVTALLVAAGKPGHGFAAPTGPEEEVLKQVVAMGEPYGVAIRTAIRSHVQPQEAILREAERHGHNLIVLGVNRRQGERLFFGNVAAAVLGRARCSVVFLAG
ncbi:MAG: cation:proton antiporter [Alphaproteobacteria bacterium]|nr:cation:proton antiporter [Alphaproteobacteria bacterium]